MGKSSEPLNDLQQYHHLKNRITELERLLENAHDRAYNEKRERQNKKGVTDMAVRAKTLIELKSRGVIDWNLRKIASECYLSFSRVRHISCELNKKA